MVCTMVMTAEKIRRLRKDLGLTQEQLAHAIGVTLQTVNRWENGHTKPHRTFVRVMEQMGKEQES